MFAAQALSLHGIRPTIISKKQKSVIYGAQYLHQPIPELSSQAPATDIYTFRVGLPEVYAERVYGLATMPTSWDRVVAVQPAWDLRSTYDAAWAKFEHRIIDWRISPSEVQEITTQFDLVISTIPAWAICLKPDRHSFESVNILVRKQLDFDFRPFYKVPDNWVVYNGTWDYDWYRASNIFGYPSAEARSGPHLHINKIWEPGFKVVDTSCDCHPNVVRAGRMGTWKRGVLTHHAFEQTLRQIELLASA